MRASFGVLGPLLAVAFLMSSVGTVIATPSLPTHSSSFGLTGMTPSFLPSGIATYSSVWGGYGIRASNGAVNDVHANWHVPQIAKACPSKATSSEFFVGMDGWLSSTLEFVGTSTYCASGSVVYAGWVVLGSFSASVRFTITPGDNMYGDVNYNPTTKTTTAFLKDVTTGKSYSKTLSGSGYRATAEWIADDPYHVASTVYPLTDFGWVTFRNATATISGHTHSISGFTHTEFSMWSTLHAKAKATTGNLSNHGSQFVVTWNFQGP